MLVVLWCEIFRWTSLRGTSTGARARELSFQALGHHLLSSPGDFERLYSNCCSWQWPISFLNKVEFQKHGAYSDDSQSSEVTLAHWRVMTTFRQWMLFTVSN